MPLDRPVVFPLLPILWLADGSPACACPRGRDCNRIGKHAAVLWGDLQAGDPVPRPVEGAGVGIKCGPRPKGSGIIVVDLDGFDAQKAWEDLGGALMGTYFVRTGRGQGDGSGLQLYFQAPDFPVTNSVGELAPGIDIRGSGGMVVAAGSPHKSGPDVRYRVGNDTAPTPAPAFLLKWLRGRGRLSATPQTYEGDVSGAARDAARAAYAKWLAEDARPLTPALSGTRDLVLFQVIQKGAYDLRLPTEDVYELVTTIYDPRCNPPRDEEFEQKIVHKAEFAKEKTTRSKDMGDEELEAWSQTVLGGGGLLPDAGGAPEDPKKPKPAATAKPSLAERIRWGGWDATPPTLNYLVDGLLIQNKVAMIYADPGGIKTWTAIDLAVAVATGAHWLGERAVIQGRALFMDYEDGEEEFWRRVQLLTQGMGPAARAGGDLGYIYTPGQLDTTAFWLELEKAHAQKPFSFVVIDTLRAANKGKDENDVNAATMLDYAGNFTEVLKNHPTKPSVLVVHHANKTGGIRGTSAFKGAVDVVFKLDTDEDNEKRHRATLVCDKSGFKKPAPIRLELTDTGLRTWIPDDDGRDGSEDGAGLRELTDDEVRAKILLVLHGQGVVASKRKMRDLVKAGAARVETELADLVAAGEVAKTKDGYVLDNEERRRTRVCASVRSFDYWASEAELAKDAAVPTEYVHELRRKGVIGRRSSGGDVLGFVVLREASVG